MTMRVYWSEREVNILRMMYFNSKKEEIVRQLSRHNWRSIKQKAYKLGLKRFRFPLKPPSSNLLINALVKKRIQNGWSTHKLARKIGVHVQHYNKWEQGLHYPTAKNIVEWAQALGCEFVLTDSEYLNKPKEIVEIRLVA
jgi:DNA-binding transcriptional regulator YiaG